MANTDFINKYINEFLEKIYYYCLKKCSNPKQAEDLASEINYNILNALGKNFIPDNYNAWVWAIARNQYSKWASNKHKTNEIILPEDINEYDAINDDSFEETFIQAEQLKILRRELAFITTEYREILIAYYIDNKKTEEIAKSFHIPKGTVVSKLHRIRKKLKEGFEMSREFGILSYKPENIGFVMNGQDARDGVPWCFLSRMIAKNIMLACYRNPMTAEELAIEMGIALPYMDDELSKLVNSTLMKKNGDKYETAIFIVSAKAQERCYNHLASIAPELTEFAIKTVEYRVKCYEQNGVKWHEGYQSYEDMKWAMLMRRVDDLYFDVIRNHKPKKQYANIGCNGHTIRPNNGQWDLLGLENSNIQRPPFIGLHGNGETPNMTNSGYNYQFGQYKFKYENINEKTPNHLTDIQCRALVDCAKKNSQNSPISVLDELVNSGHLQKSDGIYLPAFWVQFNNELGEMNVNFTDALGKLTEEQKAEFFKLSKPAIDLLDSLYMVCREAVTQEVPVFLRDDEYQIGHTIANLMFPRESVFKEAIDSGWLTYDKTDPESAKKRMLGAYLVI